MMETVLLIALTLLVFLLCLLSALLSGVVLKGVWAGRISTAIVGIATVISCFLFMRIWPDRVENYGFTWIDLPGLDLAFSLSFWLNNIAVLLLCIVTFVSFLVHLYSLEYMKGEKGFARYYSFLGLFTLSMVGIVLADSLLTIFIFWELVGFSSYLLIGFWYNKESAAKASLKAFLVNRIGDAGFLIALMIIWSKAGTFNLIELKTILSISQPDVWWTIAGFGVLSGVIGKSAQFPLQIWLPDAMEGPTPVSALIHAATMVAAGIYLLARIYVLFDPVVLDVIAVIGALTAFMGAVAALTQTDIKRVLAFSTISQLGYMVLGMGVGAYGAALFHLTTHAFFKACLFLSAGAIIHALHEAQKDGNHFDAQDMRFMGGLRKKMPITFAAFSISALALAGVPFFSGFLSKDAILNGSITLDVS